MPNWKQELGLPRIRWRGRPGATVGRARDIYGAGLPFDDAAAASFGVLVDLVRRTGRAHRSRTADLMIAATAHAHGAALLTCNVKDYIDLSGPVVVLDASARRT